MQETQVWSLGQEGPLDKGLATYSSILPGEFHGQTVGLQIVGHDWVTNTFTVAKMQIKVRHKAQTQPSNTGLKLVLPYFEGVVLISISHQFGDELLPFC